MCKDQIFWCCCISLLKFLMTTLTSLIKGWKYRFSKYSIAHALAFFLGFDRKQAIDCVFLLRSILKIMNKIVDCFKNIFLLTSLVRQIKWFQLFGKLLKIFLFGSDERFRLTSSNIKWLKQIINEFDRWFWWAIPGGDDSYQLHEIFRAVQQLNIAIEVACITYIWQAFRWSSIYHKSIITSLFLNGLFHIFKFFVFFNHKYFLLRLE